MYDRWINQEPDKFFAYIYDKEVEEPVGEIYYYLDGDIHSMGIVIDAKYRGKGYSYLALLELEKVAFEKNRINELSDIIPLKRQGAIHAFRKAGFKLMNYKEPNIQFGVETFSQQLLMTKEMYETERKG